MGDHPRWAEWVSRLKPIAASPPWGLISDVDGTLSPIAPTPQAARLDPRCHAALQRLAQRLALVAVISGRPAEEARRLVDVPEAVYVGLHGLERWERGRAWRDPRAERYLPRLRQVLERAKERIALPEVVWEDKGLLFAVHTRLAAGGPAAQARVEAALRPLVETAGLRLLTGRQVIEVLPPVEANKGKALVKVIHDYRLKGAIYMGDDRTDLDAFRALRRWSGHGLAVGIDSAEAPPELRTEADLLLEGVSQAYEFLESLADLVERGE